MHLRIAAFVVVVLQLQQLTLPALCMPRDRAAASCHDSETRQPMMVMTSAHSSASCAQAGMCNALANGLPPLADHVVASFGAHRVGIAAVVAPAPGDPVAPPAPPPQA